MLASLVFDSPRLATTHEAVQRRAKAIRYHGTLECTRELDRGFERLNVDVGSSGRLRLRFSLWSDGAFWLGTYKPAPKRQGGWEVSQEVRGTLGEWTPSEVLERIEASMMSPTDVSTIWHTNASNQAMQRTAR